MDTTMKVQGHGNASRTIHIAFRSIESITDGRRSAIRDLVCLRPQLARAPGQCLHRIL
jgi:hypothetical protein